MSSNSNRRRLVRLRHSRRDDMLSRAPVASTSAVRAFSTSAVVQRGITSNIGKQPIKYPNTVTFTPSTTSLSIQGPLGTTSVPLESYMTLKFSEPETLEISVEDSKKKNQRQMWGTTRTLINNAIIGMSEGFSVPLYLVGVGYRAALEDDPRGKEFGGGGTRLNMKLGFSHSVMVPVPPHIKAEVPSATKIQLSCTDKQKLGLFAAEVRDWRRPEPYKGKVRRFLVASRSFLTALSRASSSATKPLE